MTSIIYCYHYAEGISQSSLHVKLVHKTLVQVELLVTIATNVQTLLKHTQTMANCEIAPKNTYLVTLEVQMNGNYCVKSTYDEQFISYEMLENRGHLSHPMYAAVHYIVEFKVCVTDTLPKCQLS